MKQSTETIIRSIVDFERKPATWAAVSNTITDERLRGLAGGEEIPRFSIADIHGGRAASPLEDFTQADMPTLFLLGVGTDLFLVNTEGATYARYVAKVVGAPSLAPVAPAPAKTDWTIDQTIDALLKQFQADANRIAYAAREASSESHVGNRNGAVGCLLTTEAEIQRLNGLLSTILTLHRAG